MQISTEIFFWCRDRRILAKIPESQLLNSRIIPRDPWALKTPIVSISTSRCRWTSAQEVGGGGGGGNMQ